MRMRLGLLAFLLFGWANVAVADMIERNDGRLVVGRIIQKDSQSIIFRTGPADSEHTEYKIKDIKRVYSVAEELASNLRVTSARALERRAAQYHQVGLEFDALVCLERLLQLHPGEMAEPGAGGSSAWRSFRAAAVISIETRRLTEGSAILSLARRAKEVDAIALCTDLVARADDLGDAAAHAAGMELGVPFRPWHRIDLSPCLYEPLETQAIDDDGVTVQAAVDRMFLHIPIRLDAKRNLTLSKGVLRGRDSRSFYGLRPLAVSEGKPTLGFGRSDPVYERMDFSAADGELHLRNLTPPRRPPGDPTLKDRTGSRDRKMRASGWIAVIFEVRRGAVALGIQMPDEAPEELDLSLVRRVRESIHDWSDPSAPPPEQLTALLERLERAGQAPPGKRESLRATTLLALAKLAETRSSLADRATPAWRTLTNQAVIHAVAGGDPDVGSAAWRYLSESVHEGRDELRSLIAASPSAQFHWAGITERAVGRADARKVHPATDLLAGIFEKGDAASCARGLDTLDRLNDAGLWFALSSGSSGVKRLALARLHNEAASPAIARSAVAALVAGMQKELAEPILKAARKWGLQVSSVDDPVIGQWSRMKDGSSRAAYLEALALAGREIAGVWHSAAIASIARDVHRSRDKRVLAAWNRMVEAHGAASERPGGMFPLLVARESSDPDLLGLNAIATHGAPDDRKSAIRELLSLGYAEEVQRALRTDASLDWPTVLSATVKKDDRLAVLGLLARWASSGQSDIAPIAMTQLSRVLSDVEDDRSWQATAAIKSGLTIDSLNELSWALDPVSSGAALRVAYAVGHMKQQERERVAGAADPVPRLRELKAVDRRRGQLVDGSYGVMAVVETTTRIETADGRGYWGEPVRRLVVLPPLRLEVSLTDDKITVLLNGNPIGSGRTIQAGRRIKAIPYYYGVLEALDGEDFALQSVGPASQPALASRPAAIRPGPMVLPDLRSKPGDAGALTVNLGVYAADMSRAVDLASGDWPAEFPVTLRHHIFGTWVGTGRRRELPQSAAAGDTNLLNIMLIVEKRD